MGYTENEPRTFVLKMPLHCKNNAKDMKKLVLKKINGVDSVDVIDQEQGKVRISGNVEPQTVIVMLKNEMTKHAELLVEDEEEESPPRTKKQEMQIVNKPVRKFSDQRKVSPLLPENEPRTFVLKMHLHCKNNAKDVKKLVLKKINGVDSVDVIDQEQGKVRISGNVEPRTVIVMLNSEMTKHAELLVEDEEEESPPRTNKQEMQIVNKPVRKFSDQRKVSPLLPENEPRTFVLKMPLHCKNNAKDVKKLVLKKINGVDSVDVIDQEQGKVRISGNVEPRTVIVMLKSEMTKHAELLVEDEEEESPPRTNNQEMQIVNKPVRKFSDQRKVSPLLPDPIIKPLAIKVRDCYPAHNHELELKSFNKPFTCNKCMEDGFTSGYRCKHCVYDIHKECMDPKPKITHKLFPRFVFEFRQKPHINRNICDACGMKINGCSYRCEARNLDLHPRCSNLQGKLRIDGMDFELICKNVKQRCFSCKKKLHSQLAEEEVPGWCYVSERNEFYCHVYCVYQMVKEAWRRGDLVPNDDDDDNDGTSKALDKVNLKLVAKSNRSGGRAGGLFLKVVTALLKAIVGILFGDPTGLIVFAVTELIKN